MSFLMTHSLLSSWLYAIRENPYEDATTEKDPMGDFMLTLRREPTPTSDAMQKGIDFETLVTACLRHDGDTNSPWFAAAKQVSHYIIGAQLQCKASTKLTVSGLPLVLYGRLDALKAGTIYDIKFSSKYERGKYFSSTQHPVYMKLIPEATRFVYLVSDGKSVWTESYDRDATPEIEPIIADFLAWLRTRNLMDLYQEKWVSR